jgi:hypothetical protein
LRYNQLAQGGNSVAEPATTAPATDDPRVAACDAWNPGLQSELPREYWPLCTVFRGENVSTSLATARELSDYCGLPAHELVAFRPERLMVHELLIRVTAGVNVPDGSDYEDLGRNFRDIAATILERYLVPRRDQLVRVFEQARQAAATVIDEELSRRSSFSAVPAAASARRRRWFGFGRADNAPPRPVLPAEQRDGELVAAWAQRADSAPDRLQASCLAALSEAAVAVTARLGHLPADRWLLADLALTRVCNHYGSEVVGEAIDPLFADAIGREGYRPLVPQDRPVVMNVKGASASGKSTMRPLQRDMAAKLGFPWQDFALVSPDIWRKFLLDYASLGAAYKYAGTLTGHEIEIIDRKLDRHMAGKAARGEMPHLLIDRFRFDSFAPTPNDRVSSRLLTRFGNLVYMFFMITPPEMTVERAWLRGLKVGRYKAVEDLLAHNVEAFAGMPELFFTWALDGARRVHYEFLDNSVAEGQPPRTVAYGWNGEMTILDISRMLDIDRFRKINIHASTAADVYSTNELTPQRNVGFIERCARLIPIVIFADQDSGRPYARLESGHWTWRDESRLARALEDPDVRAGLEALGADGHVPAAAPTVAADLDAARLHTLGAWGEYSREST